MSRANLPPWAHGPAELLKHGGRLDQSGDESDRRVAMILVDNSVELIMQTYLTLPKRVTGLDISRRKREEYCINFPSLLDGIESHASDRIIGLDLGEFEWFHRLRNGLYHQGNGLTVEKKHIEVYAQLAARLFKALFDCELPLLDPSNDERMLIGSFFEKYIEIEKSLSKLDNNKAMRPRHHLVGKLLSDGAITQSDFDIYHQVRMARNKLVHGEVEPVDMLEPGIMSKLERLSGIFADLGARTIKAIGV